MLLAQPGHSHSPWSMFIPFDPTRSQREGQAGLGFLSLGFGHVHFDVLVLILALEERGKRIGRARNSDALNRREREERPEDIGCQSFGFWTHACTER
jgi:hypothetical protein